MNARPDTRPSLYISYSFQTVNLIQVMALTVVGIFDHATEAQQAVEQLVSSGFSRGSIDLSANTGAMSGSSADGALVPDRHTNTSGTRTEEVLDDTKDVGSSIGSFFNSLFGDGDDDRNKYTQVADQGSVVTVHATTEEEAERAADILDEAGAVDVNERADQYGYAGVPTTPATAAMGNSMANTGMQAVDGDQTIKIVEENLEVGKQTVDTGGVRLRSRIIDKPVEESVRLREERVTVQRTPVNRPASSADLDAFKEGEVTMTEQAEVPIVSKTANVVEEISVGKQVTERDEVIHDTVRRTDVEVEQLGTTDKTTRLSNDDDITYSAK